MGVTATLFSLSPNRQVKVNGATAASRFLHFMRKI